eukprot:6185147-Pleurochrysis_carterae.AAC.2
MGSMWNMLESVTTLRGQSRQICSTFDCSRLELSDTTPKRLHVCMGCQLDLPVGRYEVKASRTHQTTRLVSAEQSQTRAGGGAPRAHQTPAERAARSDGLERAAPLAQLFHIGLFCRALPPLSLAAELHCVVAAAAVARRRARSRAACKARRRRPLLPAEHVAADHALACRARRRRRRCCLQSGSPPSPLLLMDHANANAAAALRVRRRRRRCCRS